MTARTVPLKQWPVLSCPTLYLAQSNAVSSAYHAGERGWPPQLLLFHLLSNLHWLLEVGRIWRGQ